MNLFDVLRRSIASVAIALILALASFGLVGPEVQAAPADTGNAVITVDTAAAPSVAADLSAEGVLYQDVNSGGNTGNVVDIGNTYGGNVVVDGGDINNSTNIDASTNTETNYGPGCVWYTKTFWDPVNGYYYDVYDCWYD